VFRQRARRATIDGAPLDLTTRELSVLEALISRAGWVISKDQLIERLYSYSEEASSNAHRGLHPPLAQKDRTRGVTIRTIRGLATSSTKRLHRNSGDMQENSFSLRIHLINWLLTPLFLLWLFSTVAGYVATLTYANRPTTWSCCNAHRRWARSSISAAAKRSSIRARKLPDGKSVLSPDEVFYTRQRCRRQETRRQCQSRQAADLSRRQDRSPVQQRERHGAKTRTVSLVFYNPDSKQLYQLHMSETINQRQALIRGILANIVIPQLLLILIAVGAIWAGAETGTGAARTPAPASRPGASATISANSTAASPRKKCVR